MNYLLHKEGLGHCISGSVHFYFFSFCVIGRISLGFFLCLWNPVSVGLGFVLPGVGGIVSE